MKKKKRFKIIAGAVLIIVLIVLIGLYFSNRNLQTKLKEQEANTHLNSPTSTFTQNEPIKKAENDLSNPTDSSNATLIGVFNIIYGDPINGGRPKYKYSVTDFQGKTSRLEFTTDTRFIEGTQPSDYDRKNVKIIGNKISNSSIFEVVTIEFDNR